MNRYDPRAGSGAARWISIGSAVLLAGLAVGAFFVRNSPFRKHPDRTSAAPERNGAVPTTTLPVGEDRTAPASKMKSPESDDDDLFPPLPRNLHVEAQLAEDRGKICRAQWEAWQKYMEKEFDRSVEELSLAVDLPPSHRETVAGILRLEETAWMKDMEERLEPAFAGKGPPSYEFISTDAYRARIDAITRATDAQVLPLLEDGRRNRYTEWRMRYNQRRFFVAEGK